MNRAVFVIGIAATAMLASTATAGYVVEDIPSWRGDDNTSYYNWEDFTSADGFTQGPNFPGNEPFPSGNALLFNFGADAIIAGSGNIYGFGGALNIHTYGYADSDITDAVFNFATLGTQIDFAGARLAWTDGIEGGESGMIFPAMAYSLNYSEEVEFGPGQFGFIDNVSWSFDLSDIDADVREIGLIWDSVSNNISLDTATMDLRFAGIPAPGALALLGLAGLAGRRRRH
jgi:MYXO-CTERM domain-containing protein